MIARDDDGAVTKRTVEGGRFADAKRLRATKEFVQMASAGNVVSSVAR
jgi:hypothetical protein